MMILYRLKNLYTFIVLSIKQPGSKVEEEEKVGFSCYVSQARSFSMFTCHRKRRAYPKNTLRE
jgi:hypothetical protein